MPRMLPPTLVLILMVMMALLTILAPAVAVIDWPWRLVGVVPLLAGLVLTVGGSSRFARVGTKIKTFDDPDPLVDDGLFAHTRNPMYLGLLLVLAGVAVLLGSLTAWIGPIGPR